MKQKISVILIIVVSGFFITSTMAQDVPAIPTVINYQGYLTDADGSPLDGKYTITFRLFDESSGTHPWLWQETQDTVNVNNGLFNILLGSVVPIEPSNLVGDRYLSLQVKDEVEMKPRMRLASVAFSLRSQQANNTFWRSPWFTMLNISKTYQTATARTLDGDNWVLNPPNIIAEKDLVITGVQLGEDDRASGDTYTLILTNGGNQVGSEFSVTVSASQMLYFSKLSNPVSFEQGDRIGVQIKSNAGGTEEVFFLLSGYCTN